MKRAQCIFKEAMRKYDKCKSCSGDGESLYADPNTETHIRRMCEDYLPRVDNRKMDYGLIRMFNDRGVIWRL